MVNIWKTPSRPAVKKPDYSLLTRILPHNFDSQNYHLCGSPLSNIPQHVLETLSYVVLEWDIITVKLPDLPIIVLLPPTLSSCFSSCTLLFQISLPLSPHFPSTHTDTLLRNLTVTKSISRIFFVSGTMPRTVKRWKKIYPSPQELLVDPISGLAGYTDSS